MFRAASAMGLIALLDIGPGSWRWIHRKDNAAPLVGLLAQWVDIGFDRPQLVSDLLSRFPQVSRASLPLSDYLHLRMAEGFVAMCAEDCENAIRHFEAVLSFETEVQDKEMLAIANFWIARCQRKMGRYESALKYVVNGKDLALDLQLPKMAAIGQVVESWLRFQEGKPEEARRILKEAESALLDTDDFVTRGNIQSAYGRIARRQGRYEQALQHFASSIEEYKKRNPQHRNLARALANIAFVKRLIARPPGEEDRPGSGPAVEDDGKGGSADRSSQSSGEGAS